MEQLLLSYRDPLFGIFVFVLIVFFVSLVTYITALFKEREHQRDIESFLEAFNDDSEAKELTNLIKMAQSAAPALILLADGYAKSGDYTKAITLYIALLECKKIDRKESIELLNKLGKVYFKVGFLARARETFLRSLSLNPRNSLALKYLVALFEQLGSYDEAYECISVLGELGVEVKNEKNYLDARKILTSGLNSEEKFLLLCDFAHETPLIERMALEFAVREGLNCSYRKWENDILYIDILWLTPLTIWETLGFTSALLDEIKSAKGQGTLTSSSLFELDLFIAYSRHGLHNKVDLEFSFFCTSCKQSEPLPFMRCRHCLSLNSMQVVLQLAPISQFQSESYY